MQGLGCPPLSMGRRCGAEILPNPGPGTLQPLRAHRGGARSPWLSLRLHHFWGHHRDCFPQSPGWGGPPLGAQPTSAIPSTLIPVHRHPSLSRTPQFSVGPCRGDTATLGTPAPQKHPAPPSTAAPHTHTAKTFSNRAMGFWGAFVFFLPASGPGVCILGFPTEGVSRGWGELLVSGNEGAGSSLRLGPHHLLTAYKLFRSGHIAGGLAVPLGTLWPAGAFCY